MTETRDDNQSAETTEQAGKRLYEKPQLVEFGNVRTITQGMMTGTTSDATGMRMNM